MGIPKLSGLIENEPALYYKTIKLYDTFLVIDGNCIACWLFRTSGQKSVLNGDYNEYEHYVRSFFSTLVKCKIIPIVILDGATEARKLKCVKKRIDQRIARNQKINSIDYHGDYSIPVFLIQVFKETLKDMEILFCQGFLEADLDILKVAQFLNCPVLSSDSDFYLDDVDYIPFSHLTLQLLKLNDKDEASEPKYYINAKLFDRNNFFISFGDPPGPEFLPLLSFLLGNDYSEAALYEAFFSRLSVHKTGSGLKHKIGLLCKWLQNFSTPEAALNDFLGQIPAKSRKNVKKEILRCLDEKKSNQPSYLLQYVLHSLNSSNCHSAFTSASLGEKIKLLETFSEWLTTANVYISRKNTNSCGQAVSHTAAKSNIPDWILALYVQGNMPRDLMDILYSHSFFVTPQVEQNSLPSVPACGLQVLRHVLGIIFHDCLTKDNFKVTIYNRNGNALGKQMLAPIFLELTPILSEIPILPLLERQRIFLAKLNIKEMLDEFVPDDWRIFLLSLAHWYQAESAKVLTTVLGCLLFSSILVGIVEEKLGYCKNEKSLLNKYSKELDRIKKEGNLRLDKFKQGNRPENFASALASVDFDDCLVALKQFMPLYNKLHPKNFSASKLNKHIVHHFAQFQNNVQILEMLNAILHFPFPSLKMSHFYCGTLAYNISFEIQLHQNLQSFIDDKFHQMPTLKSVFLLAIRVIEKLSQRAILLGKNAQTGDIWQDVSKKKFQRRRQ